MLKYVKLNLENLEDEKLKINIIKNLPALHFILKETRRFIKLGKSIFKEREAGNIEKEKKIIYEGENLWAKNIVNHFDIPFEIIGKENIPKDGPVLFVANHQGYADILDILYALENIQVSFVAKKEFENFPYLGKAIRITNGIFLERGNSKEAIKALREGVEILKNGYSLVIFPEGTRSKEKEMGTFKSGSLKFAQKAKVPIVPITINGPYNLFEKNGYITPVKQTLIFHEIIHYEKMDRKEQATMMPVLEDIIRKGLENIED